MPRLKLVYAGFRICCLVFSTTYINLILFRILWFRSSSQLSVENRGCFIRTLRSIYLMATHLIDQGGGGYDAAVNHFIVKQFLLKQEEATGREVEIIPKIVKDEMIDRIRESPHFKFRINLGGFSLFLWGREGTSGCRPQLLMDLARQLFPTYLVIEDKLGLQYFNPRLHKGIIFDGLKVPVSTFEAGSLMRGYDFEDVVRFSDYFYFGSEFRHSSKTFTVPAGVKRVIVSGLSPLELLYQIYRSPAGINGLSKCGWLLPAFETFLSRIVSLEIRSVSSSQFKLVPFPVENIVEVLRLYFAFRDKEDEID